jgi:fructose-bisphosphate aldolase class I
MFVDLLACAHSLVHPGKGILAADESIATADKRLASFGIPQTKEMRRKERDLFLSAPGIEEYLSGVILYDETLTQKSESGVLFPKLLWDRGIVPGIKVDEGTEPLSESPDELITNGLIGLPERLTKYHDKSHTGFTKWRAVIRIDGDRLPTAQALVENAKRLATYAKQVQEAGMVPMVEPEVLFEGKHSRMRAKEVIESTMKAVMASLEDHAIDLSGVVIKTSMALSGHETKRTDAPDDVAEDTVTALMNAIPKAVAGIVFLSGGQTPDQATDNLRAIAKAAQKKNAPWPMTFSFARALQEEALAAWKGDPKNVDAARDLYIGRLTKVFNAASGK